MTNLIREAIAKVSSSLSGLRAKYFLPIVLTGFMLLATNTVPALSNPTVTKKVDNIIHQDGSQRPKTTGEWEQQAQEVEGRPVERLKRIGEQSVEAVKDFSAMYPDTAERSAPELQTQ